MITISGRNVALTGGEAPSLYDIGYALSHVPRFGGHTINPWMVLHHLYACWFYAQEEELGEKVALYALLHDAHEAITGDIAQPWKTDDMRGLQRQLDVRIYNSLHLGPPDGFTERVIHRIDSQMVYAEAKVVAPQVAAAIVKPGDNYRNGIDLLDTTGDWAVVCAEDRLRGLSWHECGQAYEATVKLALEQLGVTV